MTVQPDVPEEPPEERAVDRVYGALRREILDGERPQGSWLREGDVAEALGVSRTPVREAMRRLTTEGLARHEPHRGVRVESWTQSDVDEVFSLRSRLEPWGSALAATAGLVDLTLLQDLATAMDRAARRRDFDLLTGLNNQFHRAVLEASGNRRLATVLASVVDVPLVRRTFERYDAEALRRSLAHHHELVDALAAGDPDWAEAVMRAHIHSAWSSLSRDA